MSKEDTKLCKLSKFDLGSYKPKLHPHIFEDEAKHRLKDVFKAAEEANSSFKFENTVQASNFPFPHCVINNILWNVQENSPADEYVASLRQQLLSMDFNEKSNDLYKFQQTDELMKRTKEDSQWNHSSPLLQHFCSLFRKTLLPWLREITGISLNDDIDMFCAQYASTDCLLCHDDELEHRRIAYVFYLTPDWSPEDGGTLDLFSSISSKSGSVTWHDPEKIVKSIVPVKNSLVLFEVSSKSFHRVAEVLSSNKVRVSLSGWFHGPHLPRPSQPPDPRPPICRFIPSTSDDSCLSAWISPTYLGLGTQGAIQQQFTDDSEIQLNNFLIEEKYESLLQSLKLLEQNPECWKLCGPPSQKVYHQLKLPPVTNVQLPVNGSNEDNTNTPPVTESMHLVQQFIDVLLSEEMFLYLSNLTSLSFHPMASNSDSSDGESDTETSGIPEKRRKTETEAQPGLNSGCRYQVRSWKHGSHTLLRDTDAERGEYALDLNLYVCESDWDEEWGGYTSYIADDEAEELLTIVPAKNCLAITYRDRDALRFVKHVNHRATTNFFDFALSYYQ